MKRVISCVLLMLVLTSNAFALEVPTDTVVQNLHQIGYLHRLEGYRYLSFREDGFHLLPGQPVAGHAAGAVGQIDLDIIVQPVKALLLFLPEQLLCQCRECSCSRIHGFCSAGFLCVLWDQPRPFLLDNTGNSFLSAKTSYDLNGCVPLLGCFFNSNVFHKKSFLSLAV